MSMYRGKCIFNKNSAHVQTISSLLQFRPELLLLLLHLCMYTSLTACRPSCACVNRALLHAFYLSSTVLPLNLDFLRPALIAQQQQQQRQSSTQAYPAALGGLEVREGIKEHSSRKHASSILDPTSPHKPRSPYPESRRPRIWRAQPLDYSEHDPIREIRRLEGLKMPDHKNLSHVQSSIFAFGSNSKDPLIAARDKRRKQYEAGENVRMGLEQRDWGRAFHQGWKELHQLGEGPDGPNLLTAENMVRLAMALPPAQLEHDWESIRDLLLLVIAMREWGTALSQSKRSIVAEWVWSELRKNNPSSNARIRNFWEAFVSKSREEVVKKSPERDYFHLLEIPITLFTAIVATHVACPEMTLLEFIKSFAYDFCIPHHFAAHRACTEARVIIYPDSHFPVKRGPDFMLLPKTAPVIEIDFERLSLWYRQMELVRTWAREGEVSIKKACDQWRARSNVAAPSLMWNAIMEAVLPADKRDKWMEVNWDHRVNEAVQEISVVDDQGQGIQPKDKTVQQKGFKNPLQLQSDSLEIADSVTPLGKQSLPVLPANFTEDMVSAFLHTFLHGRKTIQAQAAWTFVVSELGLKPRLVMWTGALLGYARQRNVEAIEKAFETMQNENGILPDAVCLSILIQTYLRAGQVQVALQRTKDLLDNPKIEKPIRLYNVILHAMLWNNAAEPAFEYLAKMIRESVGIDIYTVNIFLRFYSRPKSHSLEKVAEMLKLMEKYQLQPDVVTFTTILNALCRAGRKDAVATIQKLMSGMNVKANYVTYGAMIDHLVKESISTGDENGLKAAIRLLRELQESSPSSAFGFRAQPTELTYTSLVQGFARFSVVHASEDHLEMAEGLQKEMQELRLQPNRVTYNSLMTGNLAHGNTTRAMEHFDKYRALRRKRTSPSGFPVAKGGISKEDMMDESHLISENVPLATWQALLAGLVAQKQFERAVAVVEEMYEVGYDFRSGSLRRLEQTIMKHR